MPDDKKGEKIILMVATDQPEYDVTKIRQLMIDIKCNPLLLPSESRKIAQIPKLGSGKTDFASAKILAQLEQSATL